MEYYMPDIPSSDFLSIFVVSALVIFLYGICRFLYTGEATNSQKRLYGSCLRIVALVLVGLMISLGELLRVEPYTQKVLIGAMVGYLIFPHVVYFLLEKVHQRFEH